MKVRIEVTVGLDNPWEPERAQKHVTVETARNDDGSLPWDMICQGLVEAAITERLEKEWAKGMAPAPAEDGEA